MNLLSSKDMSDGNSQIVNNILMTQNLLGIYFKKKEQQR